MTYTVSKKGDIVCISVNAKNESEVPVLGVYLDIEIPFGLAFVSFTSDRGKYSKGRWDIGGLATAEDLCGELCLRVMNISIGDFYINRTIYTKPVDVVTSHNKTYDTIKVPGTPVVIPCNPSPSECQYCVSGVIFTKDDGTPCSTGFCYNGVCQ